MSKIEFEQSNFGEAYCKVVFYDNRPLHWSKREWEKFRDKVDEYFKAIENITTKETKSCEEI